MPLKTTRFEPEKHLTSPAAQRDLLRDAMESGDAGYIADALGIIARTQGVTEVAKAAGVTRMALYKGLTKDGDPKLSTVLNVVRAVGLELTVQKAKAG